MSFFSRVFRGKDSTATKKQAKPTTALNTAPAKPKWTDAWQRTEVAPEEVQDLVRGCVHELKARALDTPFLLLPFRPSSDPSAARTFIRNYFNQSFEKGSPVNGDTLSQELRLTEPMVLCGVMKWCWSRLPGGVVTWEAYETFKMGEHDSDMARDAFSTFIPIGGDSDARTNIILDFFDLLAAIAAHGKSNGLGGRKLSRYAGWWAFEHVDTGNGFEAAYKNWAVAADATSHLFFAYLRSLSPDVPRGVSGISSLPISLQSLVEATEYPPETPTLLQVTTTKVVMIVENVSPTPFSLLRRAKNFEYRDDDWHLQEFANYEDPVSALTDECLRVLRCISSTNQSSVSSTKQSTSLRDASWSRFEDIGFGGSIDSDPEDDAKDAAPPATARTAKSGSAGGLQSVPQSGGGDLGRPTTPSWADFMSSGFADENKGNVGPLLLPPDKVLPPIASVRGMSSQSHKRSLDIEPALEPAELASINTLDMDDSFWWVWISSLSGDEPAARKAVFGRCALLETRIRDTKWLILEEQIKGAAPEPAAGAQIVEKKRFFSFGSRKGKLNRRKSSAKKVSSSIEESYKRPNNQAPHSKTSIGPDQHKRIQAAAAALQKKHREQEAEATENRGAPNNSRYSKTNSVMTLQPAIVNEASQAMKWTKNYDKGAFRAAYLSDNRAGTGQVEEIQDTPEPISKEPEEKPTTPLAPLPTSTTKSAPPPLAKDAAAAVATPLPPSPKEAPTKPVSVATPEEEKPATKPAVVEQPAERRDSVDDAGKKLKKKTGNSAFKSMFSAKKKPEQQPPVKNTDSKEISNVAAARAALEAKAKAAQESGPMKKKPLPKAIAVAVPPVAAEAVKPSSPQLVEPAKESVKIATMTQPSTSLKANGAPPKTRRAVEYDALSRVGTNERDAADQEFSKFDQGPLTDQPAFVPEDSPVDIAPAPQTEVPQTPTNGNGIRHETATSPESTEATQDRWKAIREAAAQRAAAAAAQEEQAREHETENTRTSQSERTDEGDTSGEETIEARVARIKARVAELTGNVEDGQRR
ncbi:hypothetical protein N7491_010558 [Penicillium cf. griseofulvum]|uniref:Meiotically up-regulated protein Msb1/Mug8 domain-containing protein n=1 Tax=Penicillium cf. griseofulvum TaxID=2972120 RepID=A0A9W9N020_9EURO|nr:hypothetical protein N7472_000888 [Penicillium cf. griseofulvum]KAJ5422113.1 hypothetical protein N7491_010558 [Penicillium cf. griseofulvum]KAJ5428301.1 hypothetical protein N7445_009755 [Penicillium cf. griseofulvum]